MANFLSAKEMQFKEAWTGANDPTGLWIVAEGEITSETPEQFKEFLATINIEDYEYVSFNSSGGNLFAGIELGRLLREKNLSTSVGRTDFDESGYAIENRYGGECLSACVYAFLGGQYRLASAGQLGVHQFSGNSSDNPIEDSQMVAGLLLFYFYDMGIDPRSLFQALTTPNDALYYFSERELVKWSITNDVENTISSWNLEPNDGGILAVAKVKLALEKNGKIALYCKSSNDNLNMLLIFDHTELPWSDPKINFDVDNGINFANHMSLTINGDQKFLSSEHFNFMHREAGENFLSFMLPESNSIKSKNLISSQFVVTAYTGERNGIFFQAHGHFPDGEVISLIKRNCVK